MNHFNRSKSLGGSIHQAHPEGAPRFLHLLHLLFQKTDPVVAGRPVRIKAIDDKTIAWLPRLWLIITFGKQATIASEPDGTLVESAPD
jgi:hypothetical protein